MFQTVTLLYPRALKCRIKFLTKAILCNQFAYGALVPPTSHAKETLRVIFKIIKSGRGMAECQKWKGFVNWLSRKVSHLQALSLQMKLRHSKTYALCESLTFKPFNNNVERDKRAIENENNFFSKEDMFWGNVSLTNKISNLYF